MFTTAYRPPQINFGRSTVLNASLTWQQLKEDDRDAFTGVGEKVLLKAGFRLYKFTQGDIAPPAGGKATPWWSAMDGFKTDTGLQDRLKFARDLGLNPADLTRIVAAVRTNWNALTNILTAFLVKDVWAFWGPCSPQPKFGDQSLAHMRKFDNVLEELTGSQPQRITLPGGAGQFFIPGMQRNVEVRRGVRVPVSQVIAGMVDIY
jgi:hypothetical protein